MIIFGDYNRVVGWGVDIIEIDGGQHNDSRQQEYDNKRTEYLNRLGYKVLRFWNNEVRLQFDLVMDVIYRYLKTDF